MKLPTLIGAALLLAHVASAQLYVYHVGGEAYLKTTAQPQPLRARACIQPRHTVLLKPGAQLVVFDKAGRNITFTKPGETAYPALLAAFAASSAGPTQAYLAYVWASLNRRDTAPRAQAPLGAVSRGAMPAMSLPADSAVLETPQAAFEWVAAPGATSWLTITDAAHDPVLQLSLEGSRLDLNTQLSRLNHRAVYYWAVTATAEEAANAPRRAFVLMNPDEVRNLEKDLAYLPATPDAAWQRPLRKAWLFQQLDQPSSPR